MSFGTIHPSIGAAPDVRRDYWLDQARTMPLCAEACRQLAHCTCLCGVKAYTISDVTLKEVKKHFESAQCDCNCSTPTIGAMQKKLGKRPVSFVNIIRYAGDIRMTDVMVDLTHILHSAMWLALNDKQEQLLHSSLCRKCRLADHKVSRHVSCLFTKLSRLTRTKIAPHVKKTLKLSRIRNLSEIRKAVKEQPDYHADETRCKA